VLFTNIKFFELYTILIFLGAMSKSAQIFLHSWLPDAMEGPTPVSALIHAATMVAAGVFLLIRFSCFFTLAPKISLLVSFVGSLTVLFGATTAFFQTDIKKVIAYSTCSQLGYMFVAAGLSFYSFSLFHLINHAFFKALLFLGAGSIIHSLADQQDLRRMGSLIFALPLTYACFSIGSFALIGFPFFSGFYSKDFILQTAYLFSPIYFLITLSALITVLYSLRLLYLLFFVSPNALFPTFSNLTESDIWILGPLILLTLFSLLFGFLFNDFFLPLNSIFWGLAFISVSPLTNFDFEFISLWIKHIPLFFMAFSGYLFYVYIFCEAGVSWYNMLHSKFKFFSFITTFFVKKCFFDICYNYFISTKVFLFVI
jgi:NADH:ubiquinone oxidoreductase subunit 5 (subunit L)/multisubunit Na+/H+ antiporter MnhA subunit